jgi:hypothetical protein
MKPIIALTCTQAWLAATKHLQSQPEQKDYTLILEVANPLALPAGDKLIYKTVDAFLAKYEGHSINTIINTIFPASLYRRYGPDEVLRRFAAIVPRITDHPDCGWGSYARRLTANRTDKKGIEFSPLQAIIEKLQRQLATNGPMRAAYELNLIDPILDIPIYDSTSDRKFIRGGPCLSHLSFKLKADRTLLLTAFYRSHHYVQRALGNLYGLAWLQHFVAQKIGIATAELVCISSMATLETEGGWSRAQINSLLKHCEALSKPTELPVAYAAKPETNV